MMQKAANKVSWYFSIYNYGLSNWQITKLGNTYIKSTPEGNLAQTSVGMYSWY